MNELSTHPLLARVAARDQHLYRLFTSYFKVSKVVSHRLASAKLLALFGGNEQNIADDSRQMFVPPPGYLFNQNDLEGAEAVVVALLCIEGAFRDCVRLKIKIHNFVCVKIFSDKFYDLMTPAEIEALTPHKFVAHQNYKAIIKRCKSLTVEYDLAKRTVHGCLTADHEVLTEEGWIPIVNAVQQRAKIAVADAHGDLLGYETAAAYIEKDYTGWLYKFLRNDSVRIQVTDDHGVALFNKDDRLIKIPARDVDPRSSLRWPLIGPDGTFSPTINKLSLLTTPAANRRVYCFTTSTGYFYARGTGTAVSFITGNSNYQMGWKTFQATVLKNTRGRVVLSPQQCKRLLGTYFDLFPEIKVYQALTYERVKLVENITNLFGYEVKFVQRFTDELVRLAVSWAPQSTIGVLACLAAIKHQTYIETAKRDWHLHNIVHDSCLQSAPEGEVVEAASTLDTNMRMELTSPIDGWKFTIGVEKSIGRNWGKKSETNPMGLEVVA